MSFFDFQLLDRLLRLLTDYAPDHCTLAKNVQDFLFAFERIVPHLTFQVREPNFPKKKDRMLNQLRFIEADAKNNPKVITKITNPNCTKR